MDLEEARDLLRRSVRDRVEGRTEIASAQAKVESAALMIQALIRRFPELAEETADVDGGDWGPETATHPTGADAVLPILQVDEGKQFTVREILADLEARGWLPVSDNPANAVRTALERLTKANDGVSKGRDVEGVVVYWYDEPQPARDHGYGYNEEPF